MNLSSHVPPGFRFHPTDEELVDYYLRKKITSRRIELDVIKDVDLYKIEPWDLQEICRLGTEEQDEWYFFSHKDKKYPTGTRTNRATTAGFWKATGRDKAIYSKRDLIGMRKTLVFYKGRAPNGQKSDWIMHEYRLETNENGTLQEEGWVVCRVFKKRVTTTMRKVNEHESSCWYEDQLSFMLEMDSPMHNFQPHNHHLAYQLPHNSCKKELDYLHYQVPRHDHLYIPPLENNNMIQYGFDMNNGCTLQASSFTQEDPIKHILEQNMVYGNSSNNQHAVDQVTDWRVLDKYVASQLSQDEASRQRNYTNTSGCSSSMHHACDQAGATPTHLINSNQEKVPENASTSNSSCQIDL